MKHSQMIGIMALVVLVFSCFLPWTYHPDLNKTFTGFVSENNVYGKPGKVFIFFSLFATVFFLLPRIWAKRVNFFICAVIMAYAIKSFILFSGCYRGICPEKKEGIWIMIIAAIISLAMAVMPDMKVLNNKIS